MKFVSFNISTYQLTSKTGFQLTLELVNASSSPRANSHVLWLYQRSVLVLYAGLRNLAQESLQYAIVFFSRSPKSSGIIKLGTIYIVLYFSVTLGLFSGYLSSLGTTVAICARLCLYINKQTNSTTLCSHGEGNAASTPIIFTEQLLLIALLKRYTHCNE